MVNLTTKQVETFFGELEYIELRLKALDIVDVDGLMRFAASEKAHDKSHDNARGSQ